MKRNAALKLAYKLNPPAAGVYAIRNLATGLVRMDASRNVEGALARHRFELKTGAHRDAALRSEWRQYGEEAFVFEVVATVDISTDPGFDLDAALARLLARHRPA